MGIDGKIHDKSYIDQMNIISLFQLPCQKMDIIKNHCVMTMGIVLRNAPALNSQ